MLSVLAVRPGIESANFGGTDGVSEGRLRETQTGSIGCAPTMLAVPIQRADSMSLRSRCGPSWSFNLSRKSPCSLTFTHSHEHRILQTAPRDTGTHRGR